MVHGYSEFLLKEEVNMEREDVLTIIALGITSAALVFAFLGIRIASNLNQILSLIFPILLYLMFKGFGG